MNANSNSQKASLSRLRTRNLFAAILLPVFLLGIAGCSSTGSESAPYMGDGGSVGAVEPGIAFSEEYANDTGTATSPGMMPAAPMPAPGSAEKTTVVQENREIIRTGEVSLESADVTDTYQKVKDTFTKNGGVIIDSSLQSYYEQTQEGRVTGKIAPDKLDSVMKEIAGLATVVSQSSNARDVTLESTDLDAQIKAAETSVARLEALLEQSGDLDNLLRIEVELSQRQAVLDSLRNQKTYLSNQVAMSTLTVYIRSLAPEVVEPVKTSPGFTAGLERGWEEFKADASRWSTNLGQSTPYLLFFGLPFLLILFVAYRIIRGSVKQHSSKKELPAPPTKEDSTPVKE